MNGWLLVRIAGIIVGIATLLRVATNEGLVSYDPLFLAWMDRLRDLVELGFLTDVIHLGLQWGIEWVRNLGYSVPDLQDEWRPAFVFSTLLFGAVARNSQFRQWLIAAPAGALLIAVWCGLTGTLLPVVGVTSGVGVMTAFSAIGVNGAIGALAFIAVIAIVFVVANATAVAAAVTVAVAAVLLLFAGIVEGWAEGRRSVFANADFNTGIDILFTMASAFVIAVAVANPPIW